MGSMGANNSGQPTPVEHHFSGAGPELRSAHGYSKAGEPLSINRAPAKEIAPWAARVYSTRVDLDPGVEIKCGLISDAPVLRVLFSGSWTAQTRDGVGRYGPSALLFGPNTKRMAVTVRDSFATMGVWLKPGAMAALQGPEVSSTLDRIILYDHIYGDTEWGTSAQLLEWFDPAASPERWMRVAEKLIESLIERTGRVKPDPIIEEFDKEVFRDPNMQISDFADEHAIERRRLERMIKAAYGQTATQVLRRARALDIAAHLRGVADDREAEEAALRFFDQSHMIREFKAFFGITPRKFATTPQPFMTITLEARQARRLEALGRIDPDTPPPWRDPSIASFK
ncbi:helix-turn-helix domain-containing protein [Erythrobacter rubeus]|uniref:AraC family transcriptional regulator n=1 Tax=Erythrobacter rubeus TaxID=2760803 RepID=A0ABR8KRI9_9SPHN|nr:helix-turn-helix domain-containing protein [Erythrobacter rubeus]MBD2843377.1 AraC family transcriptional regulator [Erythrobacter rubeus]